MAKKRLWRVDISSLLYVIAENNKEAEEIAADNLGKYLKFIVRLVDHSQLPLLHRDWYGLVPLNSDTDKTCIQILRKELETHDSD
jgi:hypothetical protein